MVNFHILKCPNSDCGQKLRIPIEKGKLKVSCPKCKYSFSFDTNELTYEDVRNMSQGILEDDGVDWQEMEGFPDTKESFTLGFIAGNCMVWNKFRTYALACKPQGFDTYMQDFDKDNLMEDIDKLSLFDITISQLTTGVDAFYKDFSNRKIKIVDAIYIVKMQIKRENPELIDAQIRYLKKQPIDSELRNQTPDMLLRLKETGKMSKEDLLRIGRFITEDDKVHDLFCYGEYK